MSILSSTVPASSMVSIPLILVRQPSWSIASEHEAFPSSALETPEFLASSLDLATESRRISTCSCFTPGTTRHSSVAGDQLYGATVPNPSLYMSASAPPQLSLESAPVIRVVSPPPTSSTSRKPRPTSKKLDPHRFRSQLCRNFLRSGRCAFGDRCAFAHGLTEIRNPKPTAGPLESPSEGASSPTPSSTPASPKPNKPKPQPIAKPWPTERPRSTAVPRAVRSDSFSFAPLLDFVQPSPIENAQLELAGVIPAEEPVGSGRIDPSLLPKDLEEQLRGLTDDPQLVAYALRYLALQQHHQQ